MGFSEARRLDEFEAGFTDWLKNGYHGDMLWIENHFERRLDPRILEPGTQTVISLLASYYPDQYDPELGISRYAISKDYHKVLKKKGKELIRFMKEQFGDLQARVCVDSAPVMERHWAQEAGLGWIGKNSCLIRPEQGSWFFLLEILTDLCIVDHPSNVPNLCGSCTKCIQACPTQALLGDGVLNATKCISYLTIELKTKIPSTFNDSWENWIFGCDICQEVCPWNREGNPERMAEFEPNPMLLNLKEMLRQNPDQDEIAEAITGTALGRAGAAGIIRNYLFVHE